MRSSSVRRALAAVSTVSLLAFSLSACAEDTANDSTVDFGYIGDYNGVSLLAIAEKRGLWKEAGLTAKVRAFNDGPVQVQALGAGDLDFGYIGPGAMWLPASGKAKVVSVNTLAYADRVIAQPGIDSMKELEGKKVGIPEGTSGDMALNLALEKAGMTTEDVKKVPMAPGSIVSAFSSGQIDGAGIWYPLIDNIKKKVPDLEEVASTREMDSTFPTAFVAGNKVKPELTSKVIKVLQKANDWRAEHPREAVAESARMLKLDEEKVKADAANVETLTTAELVAKTEDGTVDAWLNDLGDFFVRAGQLKSRPEPSSYYTGDLYTKAYAK